MPMCNLRHATILAAAVALLCHSGGAQAGFKVVYSFPGGVGGSAPDGGVVQDAAGNLYGATTSGGTGNCSGGNGGCGTVFRIAPDGSATVLHSFAGGSDGAIPYGGVVMDKDGNLYGTTLIGGGTGCHDGCGTVFKVAPDGSETVVHAFKGGSDGAQPYASVVLDASGNLYGTTEHGGVGNGGCSYDGAGTVFEITPDGNEKILHSFLGSPDGCLPDGPLIMDRDGSLFGTTSFGGQSNCPPISCGTVFKITPEGKESVLYSFGNPPDGAIPEGGLLRDKAGNLYGTTGWGGAQGEGTVFKLASGRKETVLYSFCSVANCADGERPLAGLLLDKAGNLYGTTTAGGLVTKNCSVGCGTVFQLAPGGSENLLYVFTGASDGDNPNGNLIADRKGRLYGTSGGLNFCSGNDCGTVFRIGR